MEHKEISPQSRSPFVMPAPRIPIAESFDATIGDREKVWLKLMYPMLTMLSSYSREFFKRSVELLRGVFSMKQNSREFISESLPIF